jgi:hypothetical protein
LKSNQVFAAPQQAKVPTAATPEWREDPAGTALQIPGRQTIMDMSRPP